MARKPKRLTLAMISVSRYALSSRRLWVALCLYVEHLLNHSEDNSKGMARPVQGQEHWHEVVFRGHVGQFLATIFWSRIGDFDSAHDVNLAPRLTGTLLAAISKISPVFLVCKWPMGNTRSSPGSRRVSLIPSQRRLQVAFNCLKYPPFESRD